MPDRTDYHAVRAWVFITEGRLSKASKEADALIKEDPHSTLGYMFRLNILYRKAEFPEAIRSLRQAGSLGNFAVIHVSLGNILWLQGLIPDAKSEFEQALKSPRDNANWADSAMDAEAYLGDVKAEEKFGLLALKLVPEDNSARAGLVSLRLGDGKLDEAESMALAGIRQNPNDGDALSAMAMVHAWRGRYAQSADMYGKALARDPRNYALLIGQAVSLIYNSQCDEGEAVLRRAQEWAPDSPDVQRAFGECSLARGRYGEAIQTFRRVLLSMPKDVSSYEGIATAHYRVKRYAEGRADLVKGLSVVANDPERKRLRDDIKQWDDWVKKGGDDGIEDRTPHPITKKAYADVQTLDLDRLMSYQIGMKRIVGTPWKGNRPIYISSETLNGYMNDPQWSPDGRRLYFAAGDLLALDIPQGRLRTIVKRPPGKIPLNRAGGDGVARSLSDALWWFYGLFNVPDERERSLDNMRLSRDGGTLFYRVDISSGERILYQVEAASAYIGREHVILPYERETLSFDYDGGLDRLLVRTKNGDLLMFDPLTSKEMPVPVDRNFSMTKLSYSPDGREVVEAPEEDSDSEIRIISLESGKKRRLGIKGQHPAWSPDGRRIAYVADDRELRLLDLKTGAVEAVATPWEKAEGEDEARWRNRGVVWSPDSRGIIYSIGNVKKRGAKIASTSVTLIADLKKKEVWEAPASFANPSWAPVAERK